MKTFFKFFNRQMNSPFLGKGVRRNRRGVWASISKRKGVDTKRTGYGSIDTRFLCNTPVRFRFATARHPSSQRGITPSPFGATPSFKSPTKFFKFCGSRQEGDLWRRVTVSILALFITIPAFATDPDPAAQKTVASKAYVDTKQDIITTGLVEFQDVPNDVTHNLPSLVSYGTGTNNTDGLLGNKIGILSSGILDDPLFVYNYDGMDNFVPTVRAVAQALSSLIWSNQQNIALNAYSTTFGNAATNWNGSQNNVINGYSFVHALALKQNKLDAKASNARAQAVTRSTAGNTASAYIAAGGSVGLTTRSGAPAIIGYVNGTAVTDSTAMTTFTTGTFGSDSATNQNLIKNALVSLELLKDVYSALHTEIQNSAPTGTANTLANYDSTGALGTGVATYDGSTTYDSTNDASKVAIMSAVQRKKECGGYETGHENDPDYCWLWILPD